MNKTTSLNQKITFCTRKLMMELAAVIYESQNVMFLEGDVWRDNKFVERVLEIAVDGKTVVSGGDQKEMWESLKSVLSDQLRGCKYRKKRKMGQK